MTLVNRNLSEQIADHLSERIIRGEIAPGARLPEAELAQQLQVSTNSLREGFRILEKRHLIEILPRKGARVRVIDEQQVRDLYDFLFLLLGQLAARAAQNWQPGELDDLAHMLPRLQKHHREGNVADAHQAVFDYLATTLHFARNHYLAETIVDLFPQLQRYSYMALTAETTEFDVSLAIFQRLFTHLLQRDADAACAAVREYGEKQCEVVLRALAKSQAA